MMVVENIAWCLPRYRGDRFPGGVPLHFEKKLWELLGWPSPILQPFGGKGEHGLRADLKAEVCPDVVADAHNLPFRDDVFAAVLLDPPYSNEMSRDVYGTPPIRQRAAAQEAVRVCQPGGFVVWYHERAMPVPWHTILTHRILVEHRPFLRARIVHVHRKDPEAYHEKGRRYKLGGCPLCGQTY